MSTFWILVIATMVAAVCWNARAQAFRRRRAAFIEDYRFPPSIRQKVAQKYPHLSEAELGSVMDGLREYFQVCNAAGRRMVAMPSQVVDVAWHEFILFTRHYQKFCGLALGRFLHHTPAEAMTGPTQAQDGIKRAWRLSCQRAGVNPKTPAQLPILFALDTELVIPDGYNYVLDCQRAAAGAPYCAGHIGCGGGCGGDSGSDSDGGGGGDGCGGD